MKEKKFKYAKEFEGKLNDVYLHKNIKSIFTKDVEEVIDEHFTRNSETLPSGEYVRKKMYDDFKQKVKDAIEEYCNITLVGGKSLKDVLKEKLELKNGKRDNR